MPNAVLEVQPDRPGLDRQPSGLTWVAVTALEVGGHRKLDRVRDAADLLQHLVARDHLAVRVAARPGDACARRRKRPRARSAGHDDRGRHVPDVREHEHGRCQVVRAEELRLLALGHNGQVARTCSKSRGQSR